MKNQIANPNQEIKTTAIEVLAFQNKMKWNGDLLYGFNSKLNTSE